MFKTIVGAHKKVCVRIVQGWAECDDFHVSLTQQGHALIRHEVMKPGTAAGLQLVRPDFDDALRNSHDDYLSFRSSRLAASIASGSRSSA